jgi:hypothetical protein
MLASDSNPFYMESWSRCYFISFFKFYCLAFRSDTIYPPSSVTSSFGIGIVENFLLAKPSVYWRSARVYCLIHLLPMAFI